MIKTYYITEKLFYVLNSQIVALNQAVKSKNTFYIVASLIPVSLFASAGFVSVSIIWFFALCVYNGSLPLRGQFKNYLILLFPVVLFFLNLPWLFSTDDLAEPMDLILRKIHLFLIPFGFIIVKRSVSDRGLNLILGLFLLVCLIVSFLCLAVAAFNVITHQTFVDYRREVEGYYFAYYSLTQPVNIPPVYLSLFCNFALLIGLHSPFVHSLAKRFVALYLACFIILISSAVGIVALVLISLFWLSTSRYKRFTAYALAVVFVIILTVAYSDTGFLKQQFTPDYTEQPGDMVTTIPARLAIWSCAWEAVKQSPLTGYGPGGGQIALEEVYEKRNFTWGIRESLNPHNEFISTLLDSGVLGFCVLFGGLVYSFLLSIRRKNWLLTTFIAIIVLFFCFESVLVRQKGIVFFSFFYSLLFSGLSAKKSVEEPGG